MRSRHLTPVLMAAGMLAFTPLAYAVIQAIDPMLDGDPIDPETGEAAVIVPGTPWLSPGPDGEYGTADDVVHSDVIGDVDLVVRVGHPGVGSVMPPQSVDPGSVFVAQPFGQGMAIPFSVYPSDGSDVAAAGAPVEPDYLDGLPFLVTAFADLDGDGYIGITHLDGDTGDAAIERQELVPVGRRFALGRHGVAEGSVSLSVGGPPWAPVDIAITAAALAGPFEDPELHCAGCHAWEGSKAWLKVPMQKDLRAVDPYPRGPVVTTKLPFLPETDHDLVFPPFERMAAHPEARVGARAIPALEPDPADPRIGESYTIRLDGSEPTIDLARALSGAATHFGISRTPDPRSFEPSADRWLRPGSTSSGERGAVEILGRLQLKRWAATPLRVVALDAQGNIAGPATMPGGPWVTLRSGGHTRIVDPNVDGDPYSETIMVWGAGGAAVTLRAVGGAEDTADVLVFEGPETLSAVDVSIE